MSVLRGYWIGVVLAGIALWACGPFFGISILGSRKEALLAAPSLSFRSEVQKLVPKPLTGLNTIPDYFDNANSPAKVLNPSQRAQVEAIHHSAANGLAAYRMGEGLPETVRRYIAGEVAFSKQQWADAKEQYAALLKLDGEVWAEYMLGRIAAAEGDRGSAVSHFAAARAAGQRGARDAEAQAVASFGEEALLYWNAREVAPAVRLYAQQAAYGSDSGYASLLIVARRVLDDGKLLDESIQDPLTRKLLFVYVSARNHPERLQRLVAALERHHITGVQGAGDVAVASYAKGDFALAQRFAVAGSDGKAAWVRAKLALRKGDSETAVKEYAQALRTADNEDVAAEFGVARLSRGEFVQAFELMAEASQRRWTGPFGDYWADAAYVAERVLTLEELRQYVDRHTPAVRFVKKDEYDPGPFSRQLRALLARRLMRSGERDAAVGYFDDPEVRKSALALRDALTRANRWWGLPVYRAQAWLDAARLARHRGMEVLGFELAPDNAAFGGSYETRFESKPQAEYITAGERNRVQASRPVHTERFQYRLTAVDYALKAADLVPARSEGFAAILCEATGWMVNREPGTAKALYARYLREGAMVPWGKRFGGACPAVELESASGWRARVWRRRWVHRVGFDLWPVSAVVVVVAPLLIWRYRRRA